MNDMTVKVAAIINHAVRIRTASYDHAAADRAEKIESAKALPAYIDYSKFYGMHLRDACNEACFQAGEPGLTPIIYKLVYHHFKDSIDWSVVYDPPVVKTASQIIDEYASLRQGMMSMEEDNGSPAGWFDKHINKVMLYMNLKDIDRSAQLAQNQSLKSMGLSDHPDFVALYGDGASENMSAHEMIIFYDDTVVKKLLELKPQFKPYALFLDIMFGESTPEDLGLTALPA
jgi:hypothetical protein